MDTNEKLYRFFNLLIDKTEFNDVHAMKKIVENGIMTCDPEVDNEAGADIIKILNRIIEERGL